MNRAQRKILAEETLIILHNGFYMMDDKKIDFGYEQIEAKQKSIYYESEQLDKIVANTKVEGTHETVFEVTDETSLAAILRLHDEGSVMCLNFASAKNPGGGFLNGSLAQEESLAAASSLYLCQKENFGFYEKHRALKTNLYTDDIIFSPNVPFFRNDAGELLEKPVLASVVTAAAANYGAVKKTEKRMVSQIPDIMRRRIEKVLAVSVAHGNDTLILGAWGCGVFRNDPAVIAKLFKEVLETSFKNQFKKVVFAIYANNERYIAPFRQEFES
ncbi:TIGR02452 family protein [Kordia sp.]|uniref:TIGR02452 family protein n=1 Tax=Kordia sp. TaxID=1965332 RepID=UPI003D6ACBCF